MNAEPAENAPDARYSVHSLELGLRILESFDRDAVDEMSLSEMARRIGVSRSSAFRLVHTLQRLGYLEREDETKNYRLGARVMSLGYSFLASEGHRGTGAAELAALAFGDALLHASRHPRRRRSDLHRAFRRAQAGQRDDRGRWLRVPAHATTMGRIILAYKPVAYVQEHFSGRPLAKFSDSTPLTSGRPHRDAA